MLTHKLNKIGDGTGRAWPAGERNPTIEIRYASTVARRGVESARAGFGAEVVAASLMILGATRDYSKLVETQAFFKSIATMGVHIAIMSPDERAKECMRAPPPPTPAARPPASRLPPSSFVLFQPAPGAVNSK